VTAVRLHGSLVPITNLAWSAADKAVEQSLCYLSTQLVTSPQSVGSIFWNIWSLHPVDIVWVEVLLPIVVKGLVKGDAAATRWLRQS